MTAKDRLDGWWKGQRNGLAMFVCLYVPHIAPVLIDIQQSHRERQLCSSRC